MKPDIFWCKECNLTYKEDEGTPHEAHAREDWTFHGTIIPMYSRESLIDELDRMLSKIPNNDPERYGLEELRTALEGGGE